MGSTDAFSSRAPLVSPALGARIAAHGPVVIVMSLYVMAFVGAFRGRLLADAWMVLVSGREIVDHGLPHHDTLTSIAHGRTWVDQQWLGQVLLYAAESVVGLRLVVVAAALALGSLFAAMLIASRRGASPASIALVAALALVPYTLWGGVVRTQTLVYPLFTALLWLVTRRERDRLAYLIYPLLALWANIHGSVVLAAGLAATYWLLRDGRWPRRVAHAAAAGACVFASPYAPSLGSYYREMLLDSKVSSYATEWSPTTLSPATAPVFVLAFLVVWTAARTRLATLERIVLGGLLVLALLGQRYQVFFALAAVAHLPPALDRALRVSHRWRSSWLLPSALAATAVVLAVVASAKPQDWFNSVNSVGAADAAARAAGPDGLVFANEREGDWLLWRHPELRGRVAADARLELLRRSEITAQQLITAGLRPVPAAYDVLVFNAVEQQEAIRRARRSGATTLFGDARAVVLRAPPARS